jgi:N-acetylglucosaminyl-diphospho-decaprenol L-rhamnosyltransferase
VNFYSESLILAQISELTYTEFEFIVVDNSGTFPDQQVVPLLTVISPGENLGFAKAVNLAARTATGDYLLFLNPDVEIERSVVIELFDRVKKTQGFGLYAPKLIETKHSQNFLNGGKFPSLTSIALHLFGLSRISRWLPLFDGYIAIDSKLYGNPRSVDWVSGAVMLMNKKYFDEIGAFKEDWFMYSEDIELCLRVRRRGHPIEIFTDLSARHLGGESDTRLSAKSKINDLWYRNLTDFYIRYLVTRFHTFMHITWCLIWSLGFLSSILYLTIKVGLGKKNRRFFLEKRRRSWFYLKTSLRMIGKFPKKIKG